MITQKKSDTKKIKSKWSVDKYWNIFGGGNFFHLSQVSFIQLRIEQDGTFTITISIRGAMIGLLFGKDKKSAENQFEWLVDCKRKWQEACKKDDIAHQSRLEEVINVQRKLIKRCEK